MSRAALELNYLLKTNCNTVTFIPAIYFKKQGKIKVWVINGINQWNPLKRKNTKPISNTVLISLLNLPGQKSAPDGYWNRTKLDILATKLVAAENQFLRKQTPRDHALL